MPKTESRRAPKSKAEKWGLSAGDQGTRAQEWQGKNPTIEASARADQALYRGLARKARNQTTDSNNR